MKKQHSLLFLAGLTFIWFFNPAHARVSPQVMEKAVFDFPSVLEKVLPTVVNVSVVAERYVMPTIKGAPKRQSGFEDDQERFEGSVDQAPNENAEVRGAALRPVRRFEATASGVIIRVEGEKGYIVTNAHVVRDAKLITITLNDGRRFKAKEIGSDQLSDLAVIQINAKGLKALPFADSNKLRVGDFVSAIGNPFGLRETVTSGVVSALHRTVLGLGIDGYENFIQTDASINPGNSGGALVDRTGHLVGINTALIGPTGVNVGIGLAIPGDMVRQITDQLMKHGKVSRGVLGVFVQSLTPELAEAFDIRGKKGAIITNVLPNSPAEKSGLQVQDVVEQVNTTNITSGDQLRNMLGLMPVGTRLKVRVLRKDKAVNIQTVIASQESLQNATKSVAAAFLKGVKLTSYDELVPGFGAVKGVGVLDVDEISNAWIGGLRSGDIILAINENPVGNLDELMHRVKGDPKRLLLKVSRGNGIIFLVVNKM